MKGRHWRKLAVGVFVASIAVAGTAMVSPGILGLDGSETEDSQGDWRSGVEKENLEKATLAGGCFWCTEAVFENREGIEAAVSGYAGGKEETATYEQVQTGETDHREAVRIRYYPSVISYREILDVYWRSIDPTDAGGQFTDRGPQYTTAIYYHSVRQKRVAERSRRNISQELDEPVVTEIKNFTTFFRAEDRHQNYSEKNSFRYESYKRGSGREEILDRLWDSHPFE